MHTYSCFRHWNRACLFLLLVPFLFASPLSSSDAITAIANEAQFDAFLAGQTEKPVLAVFQKDGCYYCEQTLAALESVAAEWSSWAALCTVDIQGAETSSLLWRYVSGRVTTPVLIVFKKGEMQTSVQGMQTVYDMQTLLSPYVETTDGTSGTTSSPAAGSTVSGNGTVRYLDLEGGFYGIIADDNSKYLPLTLDATYKQDGLRVSFSGIVHDVATDKQWGIPVQLNSISLLSSTDGNAVLSVSLSVTDGAGEVRSTFSASDTVQISVILGGTPQAESGLLVAAQLPGNAALFFAPSWSQSLDVFRLSPSAGSYSVLSISAASLPVGTYTMHAGIFNYSLTPLAEVASQSFTIE